MKKIVFGSLSTLVLLIVLFASQTSCKKETVNNVTKTDTVYKCTPTIQGLWTGTQKNKAGSGQDWSVSIRMDGTASYENTINGTRNLCVGTWTLSNGTWTFNSTQVYGISAYIGATQTFTATYDATTGTLTNGTFVTTSPVTDSGTFTLTEVN